MGILFIEIDLPLLLVNRRIIAHITFLIFITNNYPFIAIHRHCSLVYIRGWLTFLPVAPTLEHRASVKRFLSYQFLNSKTVGRTPWTGDQPVARPLPTQDSTNRINTDRRPRLVSDSNP
jgi:hypothetical protein